MGNILNCFDSPTEKVLWTHISYDPLFTSDDPLQLPEDNPPELVKLSVSNDKL